MKRRVKSGAFWTASAKIWESRTHRPRKRSFHPGATEDWSWSELLGEKETRDVPTLYFDGQCWSFSPGKDLQPSCPDTHWGWWQILLPDQQKIRDLFRMPLEWLPARKPWRHLGR